MKQAQFVAARVNQIIGVGHDGRTMTPVDIINVAQAIAQNHKIEETFSEIVAHFKDLYAQSYEEST